MRHVLFSIALTAGLLVAQTSVRADPGDTQLRFVSGHEIGIVRHPALNPQPNSWPKVYLPRFGLNFLYGVSHTFAVGAGLEASLRRDVSSHNVGYQSYAPTHLDARYHDILLPLIAETRLHELGTEWSWLAELSTGLAIMHWQDTNLRAPGASSTLAYLPGDLWRFAWFGRVSLAREWRPADSFGLRIGALAGIKGQGDLHLGLFVSGDWLWLADQDF